MAENNTTEVEIEVENSPAEKQTVKNEKSDKKKMKQLENDIKALEKELEAQKAELDACKESHLRMMAEYDNFRKRSAKEKEGIYADAYSDCIANLLPILDNLERASKSDNVEAVTKGLEMTVKAFDDAMEKMGVSEIETKVFDPNVHNAIMHIEDENYQDGEIVEVFQKGYRKGDKVIRYAMVKVAN